MTLDKVAGDAARSLRDATRVDPEEGLHALRRLHLTRVGRRRVAGVGTVAVLLVAAAWKAGTGDPGGIDGNPAEPPAYPTLGEGYAVTDTATSPDGGRQAVATLRDGMVSVVLVREPWGAEGTAEVVWSAPTQHELGDRNAPWPASLAWSPDGEWLALVLAQEEGPIDDDADLMDLSVVVVRDDGTDRHVIEADAGTCWCKASAPALAWHAAGSLDLTIPDGPDRGHVTIDTPEEQA